MTSRAQRGPLLQDLTRSNPWWTAAAWAAADPHLVAATRAPYEYAPAVLAGIEAPNLYTLRGPRRAGKSTVLKQTIAALCQGGVDPRRICYFAADALSTFTDLINLFQAARLLFPDLGASPRYFLIDEVTSIPDWQRGVKWLRDNTAVAADCIVATGSSAGDIAAGTAYLAGRRGPEVGLDRLLFPMSFPEFARCAGYAVPTPPRVPLGDFFANAGRAACQEALVHIGTLTDAFDAYLLVGGFPQSVADFRRTAQVSPGLARDLWDVILSDLRAAGLTRPEQALRLLERIAAGLTGPLVVRSLAGDLDVSHTTASAWLTTLANAYLTLMLFQESGGAPDVRKQRKVYPIDPLLARLPARLSPGAFDPDASRVAEAVLAVALFKAVEGAAVDRFDRPDRLFFYRTPSGGEVDFVVQPGGRAVESKYIDAPSARAARAMATYFGGGVLVSKGAVDLQAAVPVIPAALFAWLLDQRS